MADGKRRLPVLGGGPPEPGDLPEERPRGAWIVLGALAVFAVLVPLAMVALAALRAMSVAHAGALAATSLVCVGASSAAGGYLVGRFGARAGAREGALAGGLAGLVMWGLSRTPLGALILPVTVLAAWGGARIGRAARKPGDTLGG